MPKYEKKFTFTRSRLTLLALVVAVALGSVLLTPRLLRPARAQIAVVSGTWRAAGQEDAVARRIDELRNGDAEARRYAAWALGELESRGAVGPLIESLADESADVRQVAAWALGEIKDHAAIQPLVRLLDDDDPLVREMAVLSLGEIEHPSATGALTAAPDRHTELREPVIWALGEIGGPEAERAREAIFAESGRRPRENDEVWTGQLGGDRERALGDDVPSLVSALRDGDPRTRLAAAERLGRIGAERAVGALLDALRDPDPAVRAMAVWSLDETNPSREGRRGIGRFGRSVQLGLASLSSRGNGSSGPHPSRTSLAPHLPGWSRDRSQPSHPTAS